MALDRDITYIIKVRDEASKNLSAIAKGSIAATAALASITLITKQAIAFESSFAGIRKTVDATAEEFEQLERNIRRIAKESPVATNELNAIGEMAGQLGVSGVDNLTKFIDTVSKIAVTTNLTEDSAATSFARIANITQEPIENIDRMASSVVALGNNFATTESEVVDFATRIAGAGKIAGLTNDQIFGISAAFSSVGIAAEAGGTAVQKVLLDLNSQGKRGIDSFTGFVDRLSDAGTEASSVLENLGFSDVRLQRAFLSVAGAGGIMEDAIRKSSEAFAQNTALADEAAKRFATTESQINILKNRVIDLAITVGDLLLPILVQIVDKVAPVVEAFGAWIERHPVLTKWILTVITVVSALVAGIASLTAVLLSVIAVFAVLLTPIGMVIVALTALATFIGVVISQWEGLVWMIGNAVKAAIQFAYKWAKEFNALFELGWIGVKTIWETGINFLKNHWQQFALWILEIVLGPIDEIRTAFSALFSWLSEKLEGFMSVARTVGNTVSAIFSTASNAPKKRATGGYAGGMTLVGEQGPELVNLPYGSYVNSNAKTNGMIGGTSIEVNVNGSLIGLSKRELVEMLGQEIMRTLRPTISNA